jgi:hypothetical protein
MSHNFDITKNNWDYKNNYNKNVFLIFTEIGHIQYQPYKKQTAFNGKPQRNSESLILNIVVTEVKAWNNVKYVSEPDHKKLTYKN